MAANIADIRAKVQSLIQDDAAKLTTTAITGDIDRAIITAVAEYSRDKPRERIVSVTGANVYDYSVSSLTGWVQGFSSINSIAYPYSAATAYLNVLEPDEFAIVPLTTGTYLRFTTAVPANTETIQVWYTTPHTLDASTSTIPESDDEALALLGAAYSCDKLAAFYSQSTDSSVGADSVAHLTKAQEYRMNARMFREGYSRLIGGGGGGVAGANGKVKAAGVIGDIDRRFGLTTRDDFFFHGWRRT